MVVRKNKVKIMLVDDEPEILSLLEIMLESEFDISIVKANNGLEAQEVLKTNDDIKIILSDYSMPKSTGGELYQYNISQSNIPFILMTTGSVEEYEEFSSFYDDNSLNEFIEKPADDEKIFNSIGNILTELDQTKKNPSPEEGSFQKKDYKKVKPHFLTRFAQKDFDLFLEIGEDKFVQVVTSKNKDMKTVIKHYEPKNIEYFFLKKNDYEEFLQHTKELLESDSTKEQSPPDQEVTFAAIDLAFSVAQEHLDALKIGKIHQEFVNRSMDRLLTDMKDNKDLFLILKSYLSKKDYLVEHSILNIYFSSYLLNKLNWSNDQTVKQMMYACFYHDLEIRDQRLGKVSGLDQLTDPDDLKIVKEHPAKAAEHLEGLEGINHDAFKIILDHHELPDGSGFPQGLSASTLPPMSCVFILSHHIVDFLIDNQFQTQYLATKIQEMEGIWDQGNFKRVFNCAREILQD
ncbi:MAG: response regulator [Bacteriovoracaceae bacterium]|nr:response regulator [Bacteriovoracaceae bacterium]